MYYIWNVIFCINYYCSDHVCQNTSDIFIGESLPV